MEQKDDFVALMASYGPVLETDLAGIVLERYSVALSTRRCRAVLQDFGGLHSYKTAPGPGFADADKDGGVEWSLLAAF